MKYTIRTKVIAATGWQHWTVEADSEEEAIQKHNNGDSLFDCEEVEVTEMGEPEIVE